MIPNEVMYIMKELEQNGFDAYIVGGAVRNHIMGYPINDWDITTNARPNQIENIFEDTYAVGKAFGTIVVKLSSNYEITTYRRESNYDGRKPGYVAFSSDIREDLERRDFTMNAMIMDKDGNIYDYYNGQDDIISNMIQTVGNAVDRFTEDYLRVYRYIRFTTQYNFNRNSNIDNIIRNLPINSHISAERIREEFNKILLSDLPSNGIKHLYDVGLLEYIFPEIIPSVNFDQHSKFHHLTVFEHLLKVLDQVPPNLPLRLAALCHDIGKPQTYQLIDGEGRFYGHDKESSKLSLYFLKRLKYDNDTVNVVESLVSNHMRLLDLDNKKSVKKFITKIGVNLLDSFLDLRKADILSSTTNDTLESVESMRIKFNDILQEKEPMTVNDLAVNGYDLMSIGLSGKEIGVTKNYLLEIVLDNPKLNTKERLLQCVKMLDKQ